MLIAARLNERQSSIDERVDIVRATRAIIADLAPLAFKAGRRIEFQAANADVIVRGNRHAVEIIDHGEGVAVEDRDFICEPFWRKNEAEPGTGLGLAIAKEIMDALGGSIGVQETLGGGATFRLCFKPLQGAELPREIASNFSG
jgi:two-component system OmpR family sensor kinase